MKPVDMIKVSELSRNLQIPERDTPVTVMFPNGRTALCRDLVYVEDGYLVLCENTEDGKPFSCKNLKSYIEVESSRNFWETEPVKFESFNLLVCESNAEDVDLDIYEGTETYHKVSSIYCDDKKLILLCREMDECFSEEAIDDIVIQFARLWGCHEFANSIDGHDAEAEKMKDYDSEDLVELLKSWAYDYAKQYRDGTDDTCEYFEMKLKTFFESKE